MLQKNSFAKKTFSSYNEFFVLKDKLTHFLKMIYCLYMSVSEQSKFPSIFKMEPNLRLLDDERDFFFCYKLNAFGVVKQGANGERPRCLNATHHSRILSVLRCILSRQNHHHHHPHLRRRVAANLRFCA